MIWFHKMFWISNPIRIHDSKVVKGQGPSNPFSLTMCTKAYTSHFTEIHFFFLSYSNSARSVEFRCKRLITIIFNWKIMYISFVRKKHKKSASIVQFIHSFFFPHPLNAQNLSLLKCTFTCCLAFASALTLNLQKQVNKLG